MKQKIFSILALLLMAVTGAWSEELGTKIYTMDFSSVDSYTFWSQIPSGGSVGIADGALKITNPAEQTKMYDLQLEIGTNITTKAGYTYKIKIEYKTTAAGNVLVVLDPQDNTNYGVEDWNGLPITVSDDFQTFVTEIKNYSIAGTNNRILWQFGKLAATIHIKNVEVYETPTVTLTDGGDLSALSSYTGQAVTLNYTRPFTASKPSTVCLPFAFAKGSEGTYYTFTGITKEASGFVATMTEYAGATLAANTPYLFMPSATGNVDFGGTYTLPATIAPETTTSSDWKFIGTYSSMTYGTAPFSGNVYGFAAQASGDVEVGQFVKGATGATIAPMRCYLTYKDGTEYKASARTRGVSAIDELPQTITVRLISSNGQTTGIGTLDTRTGELSTDGWYTLDGRRLSEKPAKKGLYINDGRKVVIK